jgi:hypothetical protein
MRSGEGGDAGADALPLLDASATGLDAGMDCGELEDAGGEAAATDATAGDAAGAECNDTGEPTGTRTTLLTLSDAGSESLADFDVDCSGLVAATTDGRILTCPPAGCTGAPVTISGSIPPLPASSSNYYSNAYRVRIGLRGIVFAESNVNGNSESDVYTLHRDGSGVVLLHQLEGTGNPTGLFNSGCQSTIVLGDLSVANGDVFSAQTCYIGAGWTFLTAVIPRGGTCVPATNVVTLFMEAGDSIPPYPVAGALVGADYYGVTGGYGEPFWVVYANAFTQGVSPWASEPAFVGFKAIAASTTLVAVSSLPLGDGGADKGAVAVCAPGPKCAQPVWVSGIPSVATRLYADATTLYLTDASNDLYACDAALALAGSCVPKTLASPAPGFNEFRSDADNVYLLTNNSVVRIAK